MRSGYHVSRWVSGCRSNPGRIVLSMISIALGLFLISCDSDREPSVVLYSSVDASYSSELAQRFEEKTGIRVKLVSDTEATKSTGLVNRLIAEKSNPVADVFWSGDAARAALLNRLGLAQPLENLDLHEDLEQSTATDRSFVSSSGRLRMIIYNTQLVPTGSPMPESVLDLANAEFASSSCIANPLFGTTSMHAAALFSQLGESEARAFFNDFTSNGGRMLASNGEVKRRVSNGEFGFGLTDSDDIAVAKLDGKNIGYIVPDQEGLGALLIPSSAVLIKGAPNPEAAVKLVEFLISEEAETLMAESAASHFPLRPSLEAPPLFGFKLSEVRVWQADIEQTGRLLESLQSGFLKEWVESQRAE